MDSYRTQVGIQFLGIQPDITTLLNNLAAKKPDFDQAGLKILDVRSLIRDSVSIQQEGAKELGSSVRHASQQPEIHRDYIRVQAY